MTVPTEEVRLAADFPAATADEWRSLALGVLRRSGVADDDTTADAVDDLLATTTYDGITVRPLYTSGPPALPIDTGRAGWDVRQQHRGPAVSATGGKDAAAVREAVLADLGNGVTS